MFATDEMTLCSPCAQRIGQSQAAHDMAGAYLQRGVSPKYNIQEIIFKLVGSMTLQYSSIICLSSHATCSAIVDQTFIGGGFI
jgi:hypothetical protein